MNSISVLTGDTVTLECQPSIACSDIQRIWTYVTADSSGNITNLGDVKNSRFQSQSSLLLQLTLPVATVSDTGNYTCIVKSSFDDTFVVLNQTISLTVIPSK